jgi:hypothetical protein
VLISRLKEVKTRPHKVLVHEFVGPVMKTFLEFGLSIAKIQ